jgi:hypothetical protein
MKTMMRAEKEREERVDADDLAVVSVLPEVVLVGASVGDDVGVAGDAGDVVADVADDVADDDVADDVTDDVVEETGSAAR